MRSFLYITVSIATTYKGIFVFCIFCCNKFKRKKLESLVRERLFTAAIMSYNIGDNRILFHKTLNVTVNRLKV